jgi:hypothetical protein
MAKYTSKMKFGGDVMSNTAGGEWAGEVSRQFGWSQGQFGDPTLANPELKLNILYGDREEYYPAPVGGANRTPIGRNTYDVAPFLRNLFSRANLVVAEGIGHYLFDHKDANGNVVVMRELLKMLGEDIRNSRPTLDRIGQQREARGYANKLAHMSRFDYIFQSWLNMKYSSRVVSEIYQTQDQRRAQIILQEFAVALEVRMKQIMRNVANTQFTDPDFYAEFRSQIEDSVKKDRVAMDLLTKYYQRMTGGSTVSLN